MLHRFHIHFSLFSKQSVCTMSRQYYVVTILQEEFEMRSHFEYLLSDCRK